MTGPHSPSPEAADHANVHVPPPLLFATPLLLASLLDRAVPLRMPDAPGRRTLGAALVAAGVGVAASGAATFRRHRTTVIPNRPATALVTAGPYAYTRNPMYVGLATSYLGGAFLVGSWWPVLALPAVVAYVDRNVIRHEEAYLRRRFGAVYEEFCRHTRRWL